MLSKYIIRHKTTEQRRTNGGSTQGHHGRGDLEINNEMISYYTETTHIQVELWARANCFNFDDYYTTSITTDWHDSKIKRPML